MLNKNQFEKSIIALKENVPNFVRNSYTNFATILQQTVDVLRLLSDQAPSSTEKIATEIASGRASLLGSLRSLAGEDGSRKILYNLKSLNAFIEDKTTPDEDFSILNDPDIYAPIQHICAIISPFSSEAITSVYGDGDIPILFEVCENHSISYNTIAEYGNKALTAHDIDGLTGEKTVLDSLATCVGIDVEKMFDVFLRGLIPSGFSGGLDALVNALERINDAEATEAVDIISGRVLASAISTYFVYASKLIGSKEDIYKWAYTSFVKDSMNHFDKAHYPINANITKYSGHGTVGKGYGENTSPYDESAPEIELTQNSNGSTSNDKAYKAMIYRNIRLQYSTWSAVINAIFSKSFRNRANKVNAMPINIGKGYGYDNFASSSTEYNSICNIISETFVRYASAKYRTYNTSVQISDNTQPIESSKCIDVVARRVRDEYAVACVKNSTKGYTEKDIFISYNDKVAGVLTANVNVKNALAETFMEAAYLLLLNYVHATMGKVMEETDPVTGKTNKVLFEEIYSGVKHRIYMDIEKFSTVFGEDTSVQEAIKIYTPYVSNTNPENQIFRDCILETRNRLQDVELAVGYDRNNESDVSLKAIFNPYIDVICVPLLSEYSSIKNAMNFQFNSFVSSETNERLGSPFPKNKMVVDGLAKLGHEYTFDKMFGSLESAKACMHDLTERVEEGADCMASNACYSVLGGIGGSITEFDIKSDPSDNSLGDNVAPLEDTKGDAIKAGTTDTEDLANSVAHAMESMSPRANTEEQKVVCSFNKLFNSFILGI